MQTAALQDQYENFPFPPLQIGALAHVCPPPADARFAYWYTRRQWPQQPLRILDAGCGTGFSTLKLSEANPDAQIVAADISQNALQIAGQRLAAAGWQQHNSHWQHPQHKGEIALLQADLQALPDVGVFDYLHCSGVIHHLPDPLQGLAHLRRSLSDQGVAYLMVYAGASRQIIAQIQQVLQRLWRDPTDWREGLMLCRSLLRDLPEGHPFQQHYQQACQTVGELLGAEVAYSDAFLVDTYLQRCEHRWSQPEWFALLHQAGFAPTRWLDESSWQPAQYLPGLPDYLQRLSPAARWAIADQLRPAQHFALYVLPEAQPVPDLPTLKPEQAICVPHFIQLQERNNAYWLDNGRGQQLRLDAACTFAWQHLKQQQVPISWQNLWQAVQQAYPEYPATEFWHFARLLLQHEFVGLLVS